MNEIHGQYKKLSIMVLAKSLDDICPTYQGEAEEEKALKIKDRVAFFKKSEVELDKEWRALEKDATAELKKFIKERDTIFSRISKTNNSERVRVRVENFESKKQARVDYLTRKLERELDVLREKLPLAKKSSKKYNQIEVKIKSAQKVTESKIKKTELRYNTIIKNTMNSNNTERVANRLAQSKVVWERKYDELRDKHLVKETIHNNKRMEYDQIRIAMHSFAEEGFTDESNNIQHWCILAEVSVKECYTEAIKRAKMVGRDATQIEEVLGKITSGEI